MKAVMNIPATAPEDIRITPTRKMRFRPTRSLSVPNGQTGSALVNSSTGRMKLFRP
jgi:hypothetical protein